MTEQDAARARRPFMRLEAAANGRAGLLLVGAWGFAEAVLLPVVPDVALGLLALVAPRRSGVLFLAVLAGALAGTAVLYPIALAAPDAVARALDALPGISVPMLDAALDTVAAGQPASIALAPPGTPLKVYTWAWAVEPQTPLALAAGVVLNRLVRILPGLVPLALAGVVAPGFLRRHSRLVLAAYTAFYLVAYPVYWMLLES